MCFPTRWHRLLTYGLVDDGRICGGVFCVEWDLHLTSVHQLKIEEKKVAGSAPTSN